MDLLSEEEEQEHLNRVVRVKSRVDASRSQASVTPLSWSRQFDDREALLPVSSKPGASSFNEEEKERGTFFEGATMTKRGLNKLNIDQRTSKMLLKDFTGII